MGASSWIPKRKYLDTGVRLPTWPRPASLKKNLPIPSHLFISRSLSVSTRSSRSTRRHRCLLPPPKPATLSPPSVCSASRASSPTKSCWDVSLPRASAVAPTDGCWAHVVGRLRSSPAANGIHEHGRFQWCSRAVGSHPDGWNWSAPASPPYIASACFRYFRCFRDMLQVGSYGFVKVDRDVAYVASVPEICASFCSKCLICF
jgi:hypothetical protein